MWFTLFSSHETFRMTFQVQKIQQFSFPRGENTTFLIRNVASWRNTWKMSPLWEKRDSKLSKHRSCWNLLFSSLGEQITVITQGYISVILITSSPSWACMLCTLTGKIVHIHSYTLVLQIIPAEICLRILWNYVTCQVEIVLVVVAGIW